MSPISIDILIETVTVHLTEAYAGPPNPRETWFVDNEPDSGIFGAIRHLSAAEASFSMDGSGNRGSTVAANVEHLRWSLANASGALRGQPYNPDWSASWNTITVDEAAWEKLRFDLQAEFETLCAAIGAQTELHGEVLNGVLALAPHAAFHLGLIRQMIERVKAAARTNV